MTSEVSKNEETPFFKGKEFLRIPREEVEPTTYALGEFSAVKSRAWSKPLQGNYSHPI